MKNHYSVLGVMPKAELIVIKAAYRALCQMYHPDKYDGDKTHAEALMKEFNAAWEALSDPEKRRRYDSEFSEGAGTFEEPPVGPAAGSCFADVLSETFPDLQAASDYYPDIWEIVEQLQQVSKQLAGGFVATLLQTQAFKERFELADALTDRFFSSYFGKNGDILHFAKLVVGLGAKDAALELNKAVNIFGSGIEPTLVIQRIENKYGIATLVAGRKAADIARSRERAAAESSKQKEREAEEKQNSYRYKITLAMRELENIRSGARSQDLNEVLSATSPIRDALGIAMTIEKSGTGLLAVFSKDVVVFRRENHKWTLPLEVTQLRHWIYGTLVPLAECSLGLKSGQ